MFKNWVSRFQRTKSLVVFFMLELLKNHPLCSLWLHCYFPIRKQLLLYPHTHYSRTALVPFFPSWHPKVTHPISYDRFQTTRSSLPCQDNWTIKIQSNFLLFAMCWLKVCGYKISQIITGQVNNDHACQLDILYVVLLQEDVVALIQRIRAQIYP